MYPGVVLVLLLLVYPINGGICPHCGKFFEVVGRHVWRCQSNPGTSTAGQSPRPPLSTQSEASQLSESTPSTEIPPVMGTPPCTSSRYRRRKPRGALSHTNNTAATTVGAATPPPLLPSTPTFRAIRTVNRQPQLWPPHQQHRRHLLRGEGVDREGGNDALQVLHCCRVKGAREPPHLLSNNHRTVYPTACLLYSLPAWLITVRRQTPPLLVITPNRWTAMPH